MIRQKKNFRKAASLTFSVFLQLHNTRLYFSNKTKAVIKRLIGKRSATFSIFTRFCSLAFLSFLLLSNNFEAFLSTETLFELKAWLKKRFLLQRHRKIVECLVATVETNTLLGELHIIINEKKFS